MENNPINLVKNFKIQQGIDEFDQFVNFLKKSVEDIALELKPNEDWAPVFFLLNDKNEIYQVNYLFIIIFHGLASFVNDEEKDFYGRFLIPALILKYNASIYGFVSTAWMVKESSDTPRSEVMPAEHPNRVEIILIEARSYDKNKSMTATIKRQKRKHPILESWNEFDGKTQGRFVDNVMKALLHNKSIGRRMN